MCSPVHHLKLVTKEDECTELAAASALAAAATRSATEVADWLDYSHLAALGGSDWSRT